MLNKIILSAVIFVFAASIGFAQSSEDFHKVEVFGGVSNNQFDVGSTNSSSFNNQFKVRESLNGAEASVVYNLNRFIGIKGDFSAHFKNIVLENGLTVTTSPNNTTITTNVVRVRTSVYNFLGGVQIKDNRKEGSRFRPFGHAMVGQALIRTNLKPEDFSSPFCTASATACAGLDATKMDLSAAFGGGLDIKASNRISIRAFQGDYNPTRLNNSTQHNFRFSVGVVFH